MGDIIATNIKVLCTIFAAEQRNRIKGAPFCLLSSRAAQYL
jgi:hypothetical protein